MEEQREVRNRHLILESTTAGAEFCESEHLGRDRIHCLPINLLILEVGRVELTSSTRSSLKKHLCFRSELQPSIMTSSRMRRLSTNLMSKDTVLLSELSSAFEELWADSSK